MAPSPSSPADSTDCFLTIFEALKRCDAAGHRDERAWGEVHERFSGRLVALARSRLFDGRLRQKLDPQDVVQSVWRTFDRRHRLGEFAVSSWDALWGLLMVLTVRRVCKWVQKFSTEKGNILREVPLEAAGGRRGADPASAAAGLVDPNPNPEEVQMLVESVRQRLAAMPEKKRRAVEMGLAGFADAEIGAETGRTEARVRQIRDDFAQELLGLLEVDPAPAQA